MDTLNNTVIKSIVGDLRQGGVRVTGTVDGDTDAWVFGQDCRLLGRSNADFDDPVPRELFNGHVLQTPDYSFDTFSSQASVEFGTANYLYRGIRLQDIGATEQAVPANDHQFAPTMTISDVFSHVVNEHCNMIFNATTMPDGIVTETDIDTSDTALARMNVRKANNFWQALVNQLSGGEEGGVQFYRPWFNRKNKLFYHPPGLFRSPALTSKGTLTKGHLRGRVRVNVRNSKPEEWTGQVQIKAVKSSNEILTSKYPTLQPADGKLVVKNSGIWADTQARVDTLAQNLYEWLTRPYTLTVEVDPGLILFGDDGQGIDLGDKIAITYDGAAEDTTTGAGVHLSLSATAFFVYKYTITYDVQRRTGKATLELEADN